MIGKKIDKGDSVSINSILTKFIMQIVHLKLNKRFKVAVKVNARLFFSSIFLHLRHSIQVFVCFPVTVPVGDLIMWSPK